jgi:predicted nucleic acid-binding protein
MRVLLDTNIVLDFLMNRMPWANDATALWQASGAGKFEAYISAITPVNVFYIVRKSSGIALAQQIVTSMLASAAMYPIDRTVLRTALSLPFRDYEDAVQYASAVASGMDAIVTRDVSGFTNASLPILSPTDSLRQLRTGRR